MNQIEKRTLSNQLYYDHQMILEYTIEYPQIVEGKYQLGNRRFNQENEQIAKQLERYANTELFKEAKNVYEYNKMHGYPIMVFELMLTYEITLKEDRLVSLYQDQYLFTGGAHGLTTRYSQNWDLAFGRQVPLFVFYPGDPSYLLTILKEINRQIEERIKKEGNIFFDNYCQLVLENFKLENYYLVPNGTVIYFQAYEIAPYSTGIPTFEVKR